MYSFYEGETLLSHCLSIYDDTNHLKHRYIFNVGTRPIDASSAYVSLGINELIDLRATLDELINFHLSLFQVKRISDSQIFEASKNNEEYLVIEADGKASMSLFSEQDFLARFERI